MSGELTFGKGGLMEEPSGMLLVRADAGPAIGAGHVMRCLALAQALRKSGAVVEFACREIPDRLRRRLDAEGILVHEISHAPGTDADAMKTADCAARGGAPWVVVDGYHFGDSYRRLLKSAGLRVLAMDDCFQVSVADVVLNQNLYAERSHYAHLAAHTQLLLGGRYALLRNEFTERANRSRRTAQQVCRVLVTCGGSDPTNASETVLRGLAKAGLPDLEVVAVVGGAGARRAELERRCRTLPLSLRVEYDSDRMADLMAWADVGIVAAGTVCWEMAFMGLPALAIITAENQVRVAECVEAEGLGKNLGWSHQMQPQHVARAFHKLAAGIERGSWPGLPGRRQIDGQGASRVARLLLAPPLRLRPAGAADCRLLWEWRNDPRVRQASFSPEEIPYETHAVWFQRRLARRDCRILIAEDATGEPVGQVRFDFQDDRAEISLAIAANRRLAGLGTALIQIATEQVFGPREVSAVDAYIKPENGASRRVFEKAGYVRCRNDSAHPNALHYEARAAGTWPGAETGDPKQRTA